jgi:peptidoglycan/xylan/chitin deacetylase (PgdA/CDA1 family)
MISAYVKEKISPIRQVKTNNPFVALTFDDGPDPIYTPKLLELFRVFKAHATFFLVGEAALKHKLIVGNINQDGHDIGNHTMNHISMKSVNRKKRWQEMWMAKKALSPYGNKYFRPPYGEQNGWTNLDAVLLGYQVIGWDLNVGDWCNTEFTPMAEELLRKIDNGRVILFHDSIYDRGRPRHTNLGQKSNLNRDTMLNLVQYLLEKCSNRFKFVTMTELLKNGDPIRGEVLQ